MEFFTLQSPGKRLRRPGPHREKGRVFSRPLWAVGQGFITSANRSQGLTAKILASTRRIRHFYESIHSHPHSSPQEPSRQGSTAPAAAGWARRSTETARLAANPAPCRKPAGSIPPRECVPPLGRSAALQRKVLIRRRQRTGTYGGEDCPVEQGSPLPCPSRSR